MEQIYIINNAKVFAKKNVETGKTDIYCELLQYEKNGIGLNNKARIKIGEFKRLNYNVSIMDDLTEYGLLTMFYNKLKEIHFPYYES